MSAIAVFQGLNLVIEMMNASSLIMTKLAERQQQRASEGKEVTREEVRALMNDGDVKAALERVKLAEAKAAQDAS